MQFPHCDAQVLHKPGVCEYCDHHPDWQELRRLWDIAFTGEQPVGHQTCCPAERRRPIERIERWGGNVPTSGPTFTTEKAIAGLRRLIRDLCDL